MTSVTHSIDNSKIKNPEGYLQYRNQLMKVFAD